MELHRGSRRLMSEINVTPFVDVMLVLLIIFMVTAPMMMQGVDVNLPHTTTQPIADLYYWKTRNLSERIQDFPEDITEKTRNNLSEPSG